VCRDVPEAKYLVRKGMDNGFKMNNDFYQIIGRIFGRTIHPLCLLDKR